MGSRSYLARRLGWSSAYWTECHQQTVGRFHWSARIGTIVAMWLMKVVIGLGLRYLTRLQVTLVGWASGRNDRIGYAIERLAARITLIFGCSSS